MCSIPHVDELFVYIHGTLLHFIDDFIHCEQF